MKDRFRFRVWNNRDWDDEYGQVYYDAEQTYDFLTGKPQVPASSFGELLDDDQWIVEQCTGLKDKNEKFIYEGDILGYKDYSGKRVVVWDSKYMAYRVHDEDGVDCGSVYQEYIGEFEIEVIGNIHQNPELLKEEQ